MNKIEWATFDKDFAHFIHGASFGKHHFYMTCPDKNGISDVCHFEHKLSEVKDEIILQFQTSVTSFEDFKSFVNEVHSVWMSGLSESFT